MNKLYSMKFYIRGEYYCESNTYHESEMKHDLERYNKARLIEDNDIIQIWRYDID